MLAIYVVMCIFQLNQLPKSQKAPIWRTSCSWVFRLFQPVVLYFSLISLPSISLLTDHAKCHMSYYTGTSDCILALYEKREERRGWKKRRGGREGEKEGYKKFRKY